MRIEARFNGPAGSGNGGYCCGVFARAAGVTPAEVTLRKPPPLDTALRAEDGAVYDGDAVVATVAPGAVDGEPPPFPRYDAARAAAGRYAGLKDHPFPTCFVCGPRRDDGLALYPGPIGDGMVATAWTPAAEWADGDRVRDEIVWASLDCPGAWALLQTDESPIVLGRFTVRIDRPVRAGQPHVVVGWRAKPREGRKHFAGTALYDAAGTLLATGRATWIELQPSSVAS